ncbi:hypothetical protein ABKV19_000631 [Rosa sericea]
MGGCEGNVRVSLSSIILFLFNLFQSHNCYSIYNITATQSLSLGQTLVSPSQEFELGFFIPNNSGNQYVGIWYKEISPRKSVWVANRENPVTVLDPPASLISSNGNLELVDGKQQSFWSTNISGVPSASASNSNITTVVVLSDDGNLILKDGLSGEPLWQSFRYPGDTFLPPNTALGFNTKTGERHVLTCWASNSDPSPGKFVVGIAPQRPPEAVTWKLDSSSTPYWRSGPWDGSKFIGIPEMYPTYPNVFSVAEDVEKGTTYISLNSYNSSFVTNLVISPEGVLKQMLKREGNDWYVNWEAPNSTCDIYGSCGPFAICKSGENLFCKCLKGFVPKSEEEWSKKLWTGGCVRRTNLSSCDKSLRGKRDGFWKMDGIKLPDFYEFVQLDQNAEDCRIWCLNNCSCLAYANVIGIGCLVWSKSLIDIQQFSFGGQQLCLRLTHSELVGDNKTRKTVYSVVAVSVVTISGAILVFIFHKRRANERVDASRDTLHCVDQNDPSDLPLLDFDSISIATNFFNAANKLGQGGFGPVYKGKLQDGRDIAVKRLSSSSGQGVEEFKNEIILISKLRHRNLVRLMGYCIDREEKLLIYEFLQNKNEIRRAELTWERRFNIIHGIARGLLYLHRDSNLRVIHRDLKVSNILLDEKMNPKISDFGLARMFQGTLELATTHRLVGTLGYMSPEYAMGGTFSVKSDVFSFGVLLLEIVSGRKNTSFHYCDQPISLVAYAWKLWSECRGLDLMDEVLADSFSPSEVLRCIHVGLLCVQDLATDRPTTPDLVSMLVSETDRPEPKQPQFAFQISLQCDLQTQSDNVCSLNEASITVLQGR